MKRNAKEASSWPWTMTAQGFYTSYLGNSDRCAWWVGMYLTFQLSARQESTSRAAARIVITHSKVLSGGRRAIHTIRTGHVQLNTLEVGWYSTKLSFGSWGPVSSLGASFVVGAGFRYGESKAVKLEPAICTFYAGVMSISVRTNVKQQPTA